jgi:hypothetical protein
LFSSLADHEKMKQQLASFYSSEEARLMMGLSPSAAAAAVTSATPNAARQRSVDLAETQDSDGVASDESDRSHHHDHRRCSESGNAEDETAAVAALEEGDEHEVVEEDQASLDGSYKSHRDSERVEKLRRSSDHDETSSISQSSCVSTSSRPRSQKSGK